MTIQIQTHDGIEQRTRTYRKVYKGVNLAQYTEGFMAMASYCRWGTMTQLKGNERIVLRKFGNKS